MTDKPRTIVVRAAKGRRIPILPGVSFNFVGRFFTSDSPVEVLADHPFVVRAMRAKRGGADLVEVKKSAPKPKPKPTTASEAKE